MPVRVLASPFCAAMELKALSKNGQDVQRFQYPEFAVADTCPTKLDPRGLPKLRLAF
jgi:hypothetical protein